MGIIKKIKNFVSPSPAALSSNVMGVNPVYGPGTVFGEAYAISFDGEKNPGELGEVVNVIPDYKKLALRAYNADLTYDTVKIVTGKFFKWVIGEGLKLQVEPRDAYLDRVLGVKNDWSIIRAHMEESFSIYAGIKQCDYQGMNTFHELAMDAYRTSFLGGDCLVIYRFENGYPTAQVIDGQEIGNPLFGDPFLLDVTARGNRILHGIEVDKRGKHVAFFVKSMNADGLIEFKRIPAYIDGCPFPVAKMIYFSKHRINHVRGVGALSAILEKVSKLDRYTEASVSSAEERAKIPYFFEHDLNGTGEDPLAGQKARLGRVDTTKDSPLSVEDQLTIFENKVAATTDKMVFNMPNGAKIVALESKNEINYDAFFNAVFNQICASMDMPPEIALQKFDSNYSASRAAIKMWEYIIKLSRSKFARDFYQPFYDLFFFCEQASGNIQVNGFEKAFKDSNNMVLAAFTNARFEGANMPHIDPKKEIDAIREMLGDKFKDVPLISLDQATESLNIGDWKENYKANQEEIKESGLEFTKSE